MENKFSIFDAKPGDILADNNSILIFNGIFDEDTIDKRGVCHKIDFIIAYNKHWKESYGREKSMFDVNYADNGKMFYGYAESTRLRPATNDEIKLFNYMMETHKSDIDYKKSCDFWKIK